jgi:hypothetical protein
MKTLLDLYKWQVMVFALCVFLVWDKGGWVKSILESQPASQPFAQAVAITTVALVAATYIGCTLWNESRPTRKP